MANLWRFLIEANEETPMPVLLLWALSTVIVVGGVGYYFFRAVH
jgi:hypothetical protein